MEQFPLSADVKIAYVIFLLQSQELEMASITLNRLLKMKIRLDMEYLLFTVDFTRRKMLRERGGTEEITFGLKKTRHYEEECRKCIKLFWDNLLKEVELNSMSKVIISIDKYERRIEGIYKQVRISNV